MIVQERNQVTRPRRTEPVRTGGIGGTPVRVTRSRDTTNNNPRQNMASRVAFVRVRDVIGRGLRS